MTPVVRHSPRAGSHEVDGRGEGEVEDMEVPVEPGEHQPALHGGEHGDGHVRRVARRIDVPGLLAARQELRRDE